MRTIVVTALVAATLLGTTLADGFDDLLACKPPDVQDARAIGDYQRCQKAALQKGRAEQRAADAKAAAECKRRGGVAIGMSAAQAISSCWGVPEHRNVTAVPGHTHEQWVYPGGQYLYLTDGVVTAIQVRH